MADTLCKSASVSYSSNGVSGPSGRGEDRRSAPSGSAPETGATVPLSPLSPTFARLRLSGPSCGLSGARYPKHLEDQLSPPALSELVDQQVEDPENRSFQRHKIFLGQILFLLAQRCATPVLSHAGIEGLHVPRICRRASQQAHIFGRPTIVCPLNRQLSEASVVL